MRINRKLFAAIAVITAATVAHADPIAYIVNGSQQFGTLDLGTGAFQQIGPYQPEAGSFGLAAAPNGSLVTFSYSSNLYGIDRGTGQPTLICATGLDDCSTVISSCGPTSGSTLGNFGAAIYATDLANSLYSIDPVTGAATLIGATGIPGVPYIPASMNPDGTFNLYDEAIFGGGGKLYITFDAFVFDFSTFTVVNTAIAPELYVVDPITGAATAIGPTDLMIGAVTEIDGVYYAINESSQITSLDVNTGNTTFVSNFDPSAGVVQGAVPVQSPVPEPSSLTLLGTGLLGVGALVKKRWLQMRTIAG